MNKEDLKMGAKASVIIGKYALVYTFTSVKATFTPGLKGKQQRNQLKLFNKGLLYKFTPFGNKNKMEKQLDILDKKDRIYDDLINMSDYHSDLTKDELIAYKKQLLDNLDDLNKKEKTLKRK